MKVRQPEWQECSAHLHGTITMRGLVPCEDGISYSASENHAGATRVYVRINGSEMPIGQAPTMEQAQALCQSDFEMRVRACLEDAAA